MTPMIKKDSYLIEVEDAKPYGNGDDVDVYQIDEIFNHNIEQKTLVVRIRLLD